MRHLGRVSKPAVAGPQTENRRTDHNDWRTIEMRITKNYYFFLVSRGLMTVITTVHPASFKVHRKTKPTRVVTRDVVYRFCQSSKFAATHRTTRNVHRNKLPRDDDTKINIDEQRYYAIGTQVL